MRDSGVFEISDPYGNKLHVHTTLDILNDPGLIIGVGSSEIGLSIKKVEDLIFQLQQFHSHMKMREEQNRGPKR